MTKSALVVDHLVLGTGIREAEIDLLRQALNEGHYLEAGRPAGRVLWQGIYRTDNETDCPKLVAVLCRGGAAKRLKERENHIGWDSVTCAIRGHWSVENKNHWKRDISLWKQDASRPRKKARGGQVLSQLRGAILRLQTRRPSRASTPASTTTAPNPTPPCASSKLPLQKSANQTTVLAAWYRENPG